MRFLQRLDRSDEKRAQPDANVVFSYDVKLGAFRIHGGEFWMRNLEAAPVDHLNDKRLKRGSPQMLANRFDQHAGIASPALPIVN
jgi:hypothetical protein